MKTPPPCAAPLDPARLAAARADRPAARDPGPLLHAARLAFAGETAAPRWTDAFADRFGSLRALAASAACALLLGGLAARQIVAELHAFDEIIALTGPLWEIAS